MPELPEVETVKNGLKKKVLNKKVTNCKVLYPGIIAYPNELEFIKNITNQTIKDITRKGKFLIFELLFFNWFRHQGLPDCPFPLAKHDAAALHHGTLTYQTSSWFPQD